MAKKITTRLNIILRAVELIFVILLLLVYFVLIIYNYSSFSYAYRDSLGGLTFQLIIIIIALFFTMMMPRLQKSRFAIASGLCLVIAFLFLQQPSIFIGHICAFAFIAIINLICYSII